MLLHGDNDADNEKREGHAQQQRVKITTLGEECGKDAVERGHNERRVDGYGWWLRRREYGRRVEQLELRRIVAHGFRKLGVLLFGQRLNLFLLVVPVLDVLHHRGGRGLIHLVIRAGKVAVQAGENAMQLLHLGIGRGVLKLLGGLGDLILDGRTPLRRVVGEVGRVNGLAVMGDDSGVVLPIVAEITPAQ